MATTPTATESSRTDELTKMLPEYRGRFDGVAVRAPVPVGSLADIVALAARRTTVDEVNRVFSEEAQSGRYRGVLGVTADPVVSSDIIKDPRASVVDLGMTQVVDGDLVKVMSWYDNEWGYSNQLVREALRIASVMDGRRKSIQEVQEVTNVRLRRGNDMGQDSAHRATAARLDSETCEARERSHGHVADAGSRAPYRGRTRCRRTGLYPPKAGHEAREVRDIDRAHQRPCD